MSSIARLSPFSPSSSYPQSSAEEEPPSPTKRLASSINNDGKGTSPSQDRFSSDSKTIQTPDAIFTKVDWPDQESSSDEEDIENFIVGVINPSYRPSTLETQVSEQVFPKETNSALAEQGFTNVSFTKKLSKGDSTFDTSTEDADDYAKSFLLGAELGSAENLGFEAVMQPSADSATTTSEVTRVTNLEKALKNQTPEESASKEKKSGTAYQDNPYDISDLDDSTFDTSTKDADDYFKSFLLGAELGSAENLGFEAVMQPSADSATTTSEVTRVTDLKKALKKQTPEEGASKEKKSETADQDNPYDISDLDGSFFVEEMSEDDSTTTTADDDLGSKAMIPQPPSAESTGTDSSLEKSPQKKLDRGRMFSYFQDIKNEKSPLSELKYNKETFVYEAQERAKTSPIKEKGIRDNLKRYIIQGSSDIWNPLRDRLKEFIPIFQGEKKRYLCSSKPASYLGW